MLWHIRKGEKWERIKMSWKLKFHKGVCSARYACRLYTGQCHPPLTIRYDQIPWSILFTHNKSYIHIKLMLIGKEIWGGKKNNKSRKQPYIIFQCFDETVKCAFVTRISHHSWLNLHIHKKEDREQLNRGMVKTTYLRSSHKPNWRLKKKKCQTHPPWWTLKR